MARTLTLLSLAALLVIPAAEARPFRAPAKLVHNAARDTALRDFDARMSRLDALMGVSTAAPKRSRSAEAGR